MLTPLRKRLYEEISQLVLDGKVLDLGGARNSGYHELLKGDHRITVVNLDETCGPDLMFDLEKRFPLESGTYDFVLALNVLEHIFNYQDFLSESFRVLKRGGKCIIGVPFLVQYHPSPRDYWRYSEATLEKIFAAAGFREIEIRPLGNGPFTASAYLISISFRNAIARAFFAVMAHMFDGLLACFIPRETLLHRYPLGYFVTAKKVR